MGNYISNSDLTDVIPEDQLAELTDDDLNDGETVNSTLVDNMIGRAEGMVDSFLGQVYETPLQSPTESVKYATLILTKRYLYGRRNLTTEAIREEYQEQMDWLSSIAKGEVDLGIEVGLDDDSDSAYQGYANLKNSDFGSNAFN